MKRRRSNTLVALSSAAVMTVYAAGFMRTRAAAEKLEHASRARIPVIPVPAPETAPIAAAAPAPVIHKKIPIETKPKRGLVITATSSNTPKIEEPAPAKPEPVVPAVVTPEPAAPAMPAPPPPPPLSPSAEVLLGGTELHDGTFLGWGTSRHGDIQASVTLLSGRITAVSIAQCRTRYSCDVIAHLPAKVLKDQTPEKINNVSGATQSVDAFYYAVVDAMNKAKAK